MHDLDFGDMLEALDDSPLEEIPVDVVTFVTSPDYLGLPELSEHQYTLVENMSQIYRVEECIRIHGEEEGRIFHEKHTKREIIMKLGKGCHAPYTPSFNPATGKWEPLHTFKEGLATGTGENTFATESFLEGYGKMVRVKTSLGFVEDVHIGHKYLSMQKNKFYKRFRDSNSGTFLSISDLSLGDRVAIRLGMEPDSPNNIPIEHSELIGYWLGDGCLPTDKYPSINIDFSSSETESISHYLSLCEYIGDSPQRIDHKNKRMISFRHSKNSVAVGLATKYGMWGMRSHTKFIPDPVWLSDNNVLAACISKIWQTDGCVYKKNGVTAEFVSVSQELADGVHKALLRLAVPSTIRSRVPKSNFDNASEAHYVTVSSQESISAFINTIKLLDYKRVVVPEKHGRVYARIDGNIYWDRIVSIEPIEDGEFWTRSVPNGECYVGNGIISANSGKDHSSTIGVAYVVYKLLCLRDPSSYYGKPSGDAIDIINIAINAEQAKNVFFDNFMRKIKRSPWFNGKYNDRMNNVSFDKSITVYSGHSERESHEGLNLFMAILDEISGFAMTSSTSSNDTAKTADNIYKAFRGTVDSRFAAYGKVVLLSFPRFKDDYISKAYDENVVSKDVIKRTHTFVLNPELPEDTPGNKFSIEWDEDHIKQYKFARVYALCRPTWEVNPIVHLDELAEAFYKNPSDALMRYACMPSNGEDTFFRNEEKIRACLSRKNPINELRQIDDDFKPNPEHTYYVHVDLAQVSDKCAVAISHVDRWVDVQVIKDYRQVAPIIVVDGIAWWEPRKEGPVDLSDVKNFIIGLKRRGFNLGLVSFDRWNSFDIQNELKTVGISTETVSVAKPHYEDLAMLFYEERLIGPYNDILINELLQLRLLPNGKVDHPAKASKDLSDALAGSVTNAIRLSEKPHDREIEVHTYKQMIDDYRKEEIKKQPKHIPEDIAEYLRNWEML